MFLAQEEVTEALGGLTAADWIRAGIIFVVAILISRVIKIIVTRVVRGNEPAGPAARLIGRFVGFAVILAGLIYALASLNVRLGPLLGALGLGGLALAFAAQSILENFFSSILIQMRRPFRVGDQVMLGKDIEGIVEDVDFRVVIIRTFDGERVLVPSSQVLDNPITNVTARGPWRTSLCVGVAYGTDLEAAQEVLLKAIRSVPYVLTNPAPEVWFEEFDESSINFALLFWHTPEMVTRWQVRSEVGMAATRALAEAGITIPFPQRRLWFGGPDQPQSPQQ
ncbi:MAG: mechanosensitive ion channel family protein [Actinobacteria bacterium]|nr:mechanosensitive ion channel family protein [Actinomycetota bacterium]